MTLRRHRVPGGQVYTRPCQIWPVLMSRGLRILQRPPGSPSSCRVAQRSRSSASATSSARNPGYAQSCEIQRARPNAIAVPVSKGLPSPATFGWGIQPISPVIADRFCACLDRPAVKNARRMEASRPAAAQGVGEPTFTRATASFTLPLRAALTAAAIP